jgi:hypothetical protein
MLACIGDGGPRRSFHSLVQLRRYPRLEVLYIAYFHFRNPTFYPTYSLLHRDSESLINFLPPQTQSDLEIQRIYLFLLYHPPLSPPTAERKSPTPSPSLISPVQSLYLSLPLYSITPPLLSQKPPNNPILTQAHPPAVLCCDSLIRASGVAVCGGFVSGLGMGVNK